MGEPASCAPCPLDTLGSTTKHVFCFLMSCYQENIRSRCFCHDPIAVAKHAWPLQKWGASALCPLLPCLGVLVHTWGTQSCHATLLSLEPAIRASKRCTSSGLSCGWRQSLGLVTWDGSFRHPKTAQLQVPFWQVCYANKWHGLSRKDSLPLGSCCAQKPPKRVGSRLDIGHTPTKPCACCKA